MPTSLKKEIEFWPQTYVLSVLSFDVVDRSLKCQRFSPPGCKDIGIGKLSGLWQKIASFDKTKRVKHANFGLPREELITHLKLKF